MKQSAVILLLVLLLLQSGGYYIIFCADILEAKHEAIEIVENADRNKEQVTTLTFPYRDGTVLAADLTFNDEDEFTYHGRMYDVISSEKANGQITFKCYTDNKETTLTQNLREKIDSEKDGPAQKQKGSLLKMLPQYTAVSTERFCFSTCTSLIYSIIYHCSHQSFVYKTIVSPPPEFMLA